MTFAQPAILDGQNSRNFYFLEYKLLSNTANDQVIRTLKSITTSTILSSTEIHQLIAFGPNLANALLPETQSLNLEAMTSISSNRYHMPSTQADLLFWIHGTDVSDVYDQVLTIQNSLSGLATLVLDQSAFTYHDSKDLIGFEDGTANPKNDDRIPVALIQNNPKNKDGAIVFSQKWQHKLEDFLALPIEQQEKVVGRTKEENIELTGEQMPADSHVSRTDVKLDGVAQKIYRRSAPYGNANDKGLMFLAFACDQTRIQIQLERMVGCTEDGLSDHLMKYSNPVSGSYWYAPSTAQLSSILR